MLWDILVHHLLVLPLHHWGHPRHGGRNAGPLVHRIYLRQLRFVPFRTWYGAAPPGVDGRWGRWLLSLALRMFRCRRCNWTRGGVVEEEAHLVVARSVVGERWGVDSSGFAGQVARPAPDGDVDLEELFGLGAGASLDPVRLPWIWCVERCPASSHTSYGRCIGDVW